MTTKPAILITGAAKRVGAEMARYFAKQGYDIALHFNNSEKEAYALQGELQALGVACECFRLDLSDIAGIPAFMAQVNRMMPHCTALVNNASVFERASFLETDEALFDRQMTVNYKAPFFLTQAFAKTFGKGNVVNILDTDITKTHDSHFAYLLSKKVLADFTEMAARTLGPDIKINGVCPGCILPSSQNEEMFEQKVAATVPLKENPEPMEIAQTVFWLVQQSHITGQVIFVDSGQHVL